MENRDVNMGKVIQKNIYYDIWKTFGNKAFYIFGNTIYAHIFYLYCKEKGIDCKIRGFVLSDIANLKDKRKKYMIHDLPIRDVNWLKQSDRKCSIFLAAKEKTIHSQLLSLFADESKIDLYYVSDFVNSIMYHHYMAYAYEHIIIRYKMFSNPYESFALTVMGNTSNNYYNYTPRVTQGVLPDVRIFGEKEELDKIYYRQLHDYNYIGIVSYKKKVEYRCNIYLTKSHMDKELRENFFTPFTKEIQAGADLTDADISELKDNIGDNISKRNQDYCEMSALYWVWKNDWESDYIGLCHYRRRFFVDEDMLNYIMAEDYDVIYTIPQMIDGGLREEFVERNYFLTPEMWELTENTIRELSPEYLFVWEQLETSYFLLPYNMFIMRRDIFEDYCSWVFPILEKVDLYYLDRGIQRNDRYLGYIAELLNTVYAMKHKDTLKKGYVYMKMLENK